MSTFAGFVVALCIDGAVGLLALTSKRAGEQNEPWEPLLLASRAKAENAAAKYTVYGPEEIDVLRAYRSEKEEGDVLSVSLPNGITWRSDEHGQIAHVSNRGVNYVWYDPPFVPPVEDRLEKDARRLERRAEACLAIAPMRHVTNLLRTQLWGKAEGYRAAAKMVRASSLRTARVEP